jgi:Trypsin
MINMWARGVGTGLIAVALGCSGAGDGAADIASQHGEIRNGTPILFPRSDSQVLVTNGGLQLGSGTLISQEWILTAGHVVDDRRTRVGNISVRLGNLSDTGAQVRNAVAVYHHPAHVVGRGSGPSGLVTDPSDVDVALVRVSPPFTGAFTRSISGVSNSALLNATLVCNGYGLTNESDPSSFGTLTFGSMTVVEVNANYARCVPGIGDTLIASGDSGGPCFDVAGGVVSVTSAGTGAPGTAAFIVPADAFRSWAQGIIANCRGQTPGSSSFCTASCPCVYGNGDCEDGQCSNGNVCDLDVGPAFGMTPATDVCAPSVCAGDTIGSNTYCAGGCPCGYGGGDCDSTSQCLDGFVCANDYGPMFKMSPATDVCVPAACDNRAVGSSSFCTPGCPCGHGGGDCDTAADCMPGLVCATDFGSAFNMSEGTDVCVPAACASGTLYSNTFCSDECPCGQGGGDCDDDGDCLPGLTCVDDIGEQFGAGATTDICMKP